jgi:F-type H+-transporting ATPase subunit delta
VSDTVARRYAQALIEVAGNARTIEAVAKALDKFVATAGGGEGKLAEVLASPVFTVEERRAVLDQVLAKLDLHQLAANTLRLANDKRRMALVPAIARVFRALADEKAGRVRVLVQTAEPLTPPLEAEVKAAMEGLTGKTVVLHTEVRPELIGGLVARIGDRVYDSSLRTRLRNLQHQLLSGPIAQA